LEWEEGFAIECKGYKKVAGSNSSSPALPYEIQGYVL
jgi:hypothetical protein